MIFYGPAKSLLSLFLPFVEDFTVDKMIIDTKTRPPFYHTSTRRRYVYAEKTSQLSSVHAQRFYVRVPSVQAHNGRYDRKCVRQLFTRMPPTALPCLGLYFGNLHGITLKLLTYRVHFMNKPCKETLIN